jgi:hypothetical protein
LYVVGGRDLGTTAANLDRALQQIFAAATAWKAIVLIDEVSITFLTKHCLLTISILQADDFLEHRSMHDLERNTMVGMRWEAHLKPAFWA